MHYKYTSVNHIASKGLKHNCDICKGCGLESETIEHMLFRCPKT